MLARKELVTEKLSLCVCVCVVFRVTAYVAHGAERCWGDAVRVPIHAQVKKRFGAVASSGNKPSGGFKRGGATGRMKNR